MSKKNYDTWRIKVKALLLKIDTWQYVSGEKSKLIISEEPNSRATSQAACDRWMIEDRKAKLYLILCISSSELKHTRNCTTSKEI